MKTFEIVVGSREYWETSVTMDEKKRVHVVAAVIACGEKILCVQRGANKRDYISRKWEFPGGKIEANETSREALAREIKEELLTEVSVGERLTTVDHSYPDFRIIMECYMCDIEPNAINELTLTEHLDSLWLTPSGSEFQNLDWAAADLPIVKELVKRAST